MAELQKLKKSNKDATTGEVDHSKCLLKKQMKWSEWSLLNKKSQNCVKAAIAFVCTTCKRQLLFALLQKITFVCTIATDN